MSTRIYNCKNEELPVIGGYIAFSLNRDLADFAAFSPKFNEDFVLTFRQKIQSTTELLSPKVETAELKVTTLRLYKVINGLTGQINGLSVYIKMAKTAIPITITDFGITALRKKINLKDAEGIEQTLRIVIDNTQKYLNVLTEQGLTDSFVTNLTNALTSISNDNQKQYEIISNRKGLVQNNVVILNDLYTGIVDICEVGKVLYKGKNSSKLQDYTFHDLLKKVRIIHKPKEKEKEEPSNEQAS
ncbi:MAG: hypothetical protein LBT24_07035 [Tannerella sp.]|jgi:hypothetical protein|nr:hypothetical protein [Tannerella sp.]